MGIETIRVDKQIIGQKGRIYIIAETASSHEGNLEMALRLMEAALSAGADAVKFQIFSAQELLTPDHPKYRSFQEIELSPSEWKEIFRQTVSRGMTFIAEVFDERSVLLMEQLGAPAYKIHSTDLMNPILMRNVAMAGKPVFVSCGGSTLEEVRYAHELLKDSGNHQIILMDGFQGFPTEIQDIRLGFLETLQKEFPCPVGYADHIDAEMEMAIFFPFLAVGAGASVIEKHLTLNRRLKGRDYYSALNPDEFKKMVRFIRQIEVGLGNPEGHLSEAEQTYRKLMKKSIVAKRKLMPGHKLALTDLAFRRTVLPGLPPAVYGELLEREVKKRLEANALLLKQDVG